MTRFSFLFSLAFLSSRAALAQPASAAPQVPAPAPESSAVSPPAASAPPATPAATPAPDAWRAEAPSARPLEPPARQMDLATPPPAPVVLRGRHVHDGFYFRFASGFGVYEEALTSEDSDVYDGQVEGTTRGLGSLSEIELGGSLKPGLILGGGIYTLELVTGTFRIDRDSADIPPPELDPERRSLVLVGPFLNWYPNPRRGFHLHGAIGLASLSSERFERGSRNYETVGGGIALGIGHDWWIGDEWSIGVMGRILGAVVSGEDNAGVRFVHAVGSSPSLLLSVTYN